MTPETVLFPEFPIILVDDEAQVLETERLGLEMSGISHVLICSDSRQAQALFERHPEGVAVIDLLMPHMDGRQLLELASRQFPDLVVIVLTGVNDIASAVQCVKMGAFDYLTKPVNLARLRQAIEAQLPTAPRPVRP